MRQLAYVWGLCRFALRANPLLYLSLAVTLLSAAIELAAMASLMPLLAMVSGDAPAQGPIVTALRHLGIDATPRNLVGAFLVLFLARIVTQIAGQTLFTFLGRRVMAQLGSTAFRQITTHVPLTEINRNSIGYYIGLAGEEAFRASIVVISLAQFVGTAFLSALYFAAIVYFSPAAAWVLLGFLALSGAFVLAISRISARLGARQASQSRASASVFLDSLNNLKVVRAFSAESYVSDLYRRIVFTYSRTWFWIDELAVLSRLVPVVILLAACATWLAMSSGSLQALGLPFVVTMIAFLVRFFPTLGQGVSLLMKVSAEARSGKDMSAVLGGGAAATDDAHRHLPPVETIAFEDVGFAFPGDTPKDILRAFSCRLERGRSYALAGRSGAGKSTLADLLLGFLAVQSGRILINDVPIESLDPREVRKRILLVGQEPAIFNDTMANNLTLGTEADAATLAEAAAMAELSQVIRDMPKGLDTVIQYHGRNLSGGQRQRMALARGLLREPDVLILDESTSALDKPTQAAVVNNILERYKDRIVVFITHDPDIMSSVTDVIHLPDLRPDAGEDA